MSTLMTEYKITYKQKFGGEILTDSYIRLVSDKRVLAQIEKDLYSDPHVISVDISKS